MNERIVAAIPHYNSPDTVIPLIGQLKQDAFDAIYLLDDASRPEAINKIKAAHPDIYCRLGETNLGPGGNRNRVLKDVQGGVIYFIDADMEQVSDKVVETLRHYYGEERHRLIGAQVLTKLGVPMGWNYGHEMHPVHDARFEELSGMLLDSTDDIARQRILGKLKEHGWDYPWLTNKPLGYRQADWAAEGCFAVAAEDFAAIGGYDEQMRYHEGQDLAKRLRDKGVEIGVTSDLVVRHLEVEVRERRNDDFREGQYYFYKKHWNMPREIFEKLYE